MINGRLLDEAIINVARKQFYSELREVMVFGSLEMSRVFSEYMKLVNDDVQDEEEQDWY